MVKAISYINCDWLNHEMWFENPTFMGIDARIQTSKYIENKWLEEINQEKYIHSSESLYDDLSENR